MASNCLCLNEDLLKNNSLVLVILNILSIYFFFLVIYYMHLVHLKFSLSTALKALNNEGHRSGHVSDF